MAQNLYDLRAGKAIPMKAWIVAPNYDLTNKVFEYLTKWFIALHPELARYVSRRQPASIKIPSGPRVECKSADNPEGLLGEELDLLVVDECSRVKREIYESYLFPTLAMRKGKTVFISTPFGQNWFFSKFQQNPDSRFQFRSIDNPYFTQEEWDRAKRMLPEQVFNQEYEASFLPDAAAVFRGIDDIVKEGIPSDVMSSHYYVMGVDLGRVHDFTVLTVIDTRTNETVYISRFKNIEYPFQKKRIAATAKRYNNARIIVDSTGVGLPIKEDLEREGLFIDDFIFSNKSKKELVEKLSIYIEQRHVFIPNNVTLIDELKAFGYQLTPAGNIKYGAPTGLYDDMVDSLALAVWGLNPGMPKQVNKMKEELLKRQKSRRPIKSYI